MWDASLFVLSLGRHLVGRAARTTKRGWWLHRRLRGNVDIDGRVEMVRALQAPFSRSGVPACRVVVERRQDDGSWEVIFDETQVGELEVVSPDGRIRIAGGPVDLMVPPALTFPGRIVSRALGGHHALPAEDEDIRASSIFWGRRVAVITTTSSTSSASSSLPLLLPAPLLCCPPLTSPVSSPFFTFFGGTYSFTGGGSSSSSTTSTRTPGCEAGSSCATTTTGHAATISTTSQTRLSMVSFPSAAVGSASPPGA